MTIIDEAKLLEQYNLDFNKKMEKISKSIKYRYYCNVCNGTGKKYISPICDYDGIDRKCYECNGTGYKYDITT